MTPGLSCKDERRREDVRQAPLLGIDYVEVSNSDPQTLEVFFLGKAPQHVRPANVRITGGRRIPDVHAVSLRAHRQPDSTRDDMLEVRVNQEGDFSEYTLSFIELDEKGVATGRPMPGFDVRYASATFHFRVDCPSDLDCKQPAICPPPDRKQPDINYLAKDYGSFRQLILDRLAVTLPQWRENHTADIGIMLVELLAYAADYLSYYQDAVATEAYLGTARQRISIRRHARLVDYFLHEGCNARAWITIATDTDGPLDPRNIYFTTPIAGPSDRHVFQAADLSRLLVGSFEVFEPLVADAAQPIQLYAAHSEIHFYTWGDCECCLPKGATSATLADTGLHLAPGDVLIFEEVLGPKTGSPADADPRHRQAVRLTKVTKGFDALYRTEGSENGFAIVEIEWCFEDALTFPLCISAKMPAPDCTCKTNISVARGNVVLVDHGAHTVEEIGTVGTESSQETCACDCQPPGITVTAATFRPELSQVPLTWWQPLPACFCASPALTQDPRQALPWIELTGVETTPGGDITTNWTPKRDLLESGAADTDFVVEIDNSGIAHLRFGDGSLGSMPRAGTRFTATYRVGNGAAGNVGAESISSIVFRTLTEGAGNLVPRNPLPASGGIDPETIDEARMFAPTAIKSILERAITADDYAALASDNSRRLRERNALFVAPGPAPEKLPREAQEEESGEELPPIPDICFQPFRPLQGAKARLRWTGSWNQVLVAVDPLGTEDAEPEMLEEVRQYLEPYRRVGHDLYVQPAQYVGIDLGVDVCVLPNFLRGHVEAALLDVFSNRILADGTRGFFHPDNLTFGDGVYASRIVAAAQAVTGVSSVRLTRLKRLVIGEAPPVAGESDVPKSGVLDLGSFEIPRLDNDPNFPENGRLTLTLGGGR
ncbi:MAG: putative baseplate assembly protein [Terriglobia bacterium]|nr:MAG: putative baseplate assembly protein [Terriglobia bacterium]